MGSPRWGLEASEDRRRGWNEEEERMSGHGTVEGELRYHGNIGCRERSTETDVEMD